MSTEFITIIFQCTCQLRGRLSEALRSTSRPRATSWPPLLYRVLYKQLVNNNKKKNLKTVSRILLNRYALCQAVG